jgi:prolyl oligopeptidase
MYRRSLKRPSFYWLAIGFACIALAADSPDKYLWLEDVWNPRALEWVKAHNARTEKVLEADPHFTAFEATAQKILESQERLPVPRFHASEVYNTWQDAQHVRGILRRTSLADYKNAAPHWQTVLDYDALARQDGQSWVQKGLDCLAPKQDLCLVRLSAGGEDATTEREFDLKAGRFVEDGFVLPRSKQFVAWLDKDTLLVARDWGAGSMTSSGYPFVVKLWKRGEPLEKAAEIFRGEPSDMLADAIVLHDAAGHRLAILHREISFFESRYWIWDTAKARPLALPPKADIEDLVAGDLIVTLHQPWTIPGQQTIPEGSVISLDAAAVERDPAHLRPSIVFRPTATEFAQHVAVTKDQLLLTTLANVQGRAYVLKRDAAGHWTRTGLEIPAHRSVTIETADPLSDGFFLSTTGFLNPSSLLLGDAAAAEVREIKTLPPQFDAARDTVEQLAATSKDGTRVPYFVVRPKELKYDGRNPTLLSAYGGFEISMTPSYSAVLGKLWLERGGVYVLANIRGGGEFGPAWHEAGLKTHRQRIYDDFAAVAQDLVAHRITSPRYLGIQGGSNGGLLMGVEMTQHPEMWNAVVIEIPLLDMLRFEHIAAGSSWTGEYGSVSNPQERAFLASISPYNRLRPDVTYPEPLIFTTTKDDRVGPVHARKFAAKMEEFGKPFFYYEIIEGGHGAGANLKQEAKTDAVVFTYLSRKLMSSENGDGSHAQANSAGARTEW